MGLADLRAKLIEAAEHNAQRSIEETDADDARHYAEASESLVRALDGVEHLPRDPDPPGLSGRARELLSGMLARDLHPHVASVGRGDLEAMGELEGLCR